MSTTAQSSGRHLSIGEVLAQLRDDFPDITISKIRFLESQGLIDPERTPSGYRKFYAPDLARLRWILGQQRDHFLPLRVIKARLDAFGPSGAPPGEPTREATPVTPEPDLPMQATATEPRDQTPAPVDSIREPRETAPDRLPEQPRHQERPEQPEPRERDERPAAPPQPEHVDRPQPPTSGVPASSSPPPSPPASEPRPATPPPSPTSSPPQPASPPASQPPRPAPPPSRPVTPAPRPAPAPLPAADLPFDDFVDEVEEATEGLGDITRADGVPGTSGMSRAELLEATGLSEVQLDALEEFGIVTPLAGDGERALYDEEALTLAELSAGYYARGIEARHLKMYQHFSEREAALFAQALVQYLRQRNPKARDRLQEELEELARLGRRLRTAMLRRALGKSLSE